MRMNNQQKQPLVSAIITTHNRKELAVAAIDSVLSQTYTALELIVVDDASDYDTSNYIKKKSVQDNFTYIYIDPSKSCGGNRARNIGINASKGDLVAFLDDDDEWMPEKIEAQVEFLDSHLDYGVVSCLRIKEIDFKTRIPERNNKIVGDIHTEIFTCIPYLTSTLMIRREILKSIGGFDETLQFWQEYDLAIRYAQCTMVGCLDKYLCLYRVIHSDKNRLTNKLDGWEKTVEYFEKKHWDIINMLPKDIQKKHKLRIVSDGQIRSMNAGNKRKEIGYSFEVMRLSPSLKNLIKLCFSIIGIKW